MKLGLIVAIIFLGALLIALLVLLWRSSYANWTAKPQLLTRKELLKSIPPAFNVYEYEFSSSKRPGSFPLAVDVFDPTAKVLALSALVHDSERVFLPMPPPCPFQVLSSEVSTNGECGRTVISAVNQLLHHSEDPSLQQWRFFQNPLLTTSGDDGDVQEVGDPDFVAMKVQTKHGRLQSYGNRSVATIEGKWPSVAGGYKQGDPLPDTITLYQDKSAGEKTFASAVRQEFRYMEARDQPFGLLTFLCFYVLLYHDGKGSLWITRALPYDSKHPTIVEIVYYMVVENNRYKETKLWPAAPLSVCALAPSCAPQPTRKSARVVHLAPADSDTEKTAATISGTSLVPKFCFSNFSIRGTLGQGRSGLVYRGSLGDVPVAVKVVDSERRGAHKMLKELATEHAVLCHLQPLWGSDVPRVMGYGMCSDLPFRVLILELVVGTWLDAHSPKIVRQSAVDALKRIHEVRVMHGDIRSENILVTKDLRVVFLDFGFAKIDSNKEEREAELSSLQEMLDIDC